MRIRPFVVHIDGALLWPRNASTNPARTSQAHPPLSSPCRRVRRVAGVASIGPGRAAPAL